MSLTAVILIVASAFVHAGWNLLSKSRRPTAAFFLVASLSGTVLLSPVLVLYRHTLLNGIPVRVWVLLLMTGFCMAMYYASLAGAYRAGDLSVAYPLARSSPVIVVSVATLILGRGDQVTAQCIVGIVLVVGGCLLVPVQRFRDLRLRNYLNATCGLALLAAIGTSGYSMLDDEALRVLRSAPGVPLNTTQTALLYLCLEGWAAVFWLGLFVVARRESRAGLQQVLRTGKRHAALAGIGIHLAYGIVLISLAFVQNVSYVVALRQLSIPLGAVFGVLVLKEAPHRPKIAGLAIMACGLVLVALG